MLHSFFFQSETLFRERENGVYVKFRTGIIVSMTRFEEWINIKEISDRGGGGLEERKMEYIRDRKEYKKRIWKGWLGGKDRMREWNWEKEVAFDRRFVFFNVFAVFKSREFSPCGGEKDVPALRKNSLPNFLCINQILYSVERTVTIDVKINSVENFKASSKRLRGKINWKSIVTKSLIYDMETKY